MAANPSLAVAPAPSPSSYHPRPSYSIRPPQPLNPHNSLQHYLRNVIHGGCCSKADFISAMKACSFIQDFQLGRAIHTHITKSGYGSDRYVATSIISLYSSCGHLSSARQLFEGTPERDAVLWTVMIVGYAENGDIASARSLFDEFPDKDVVAWNAMLTCYLRCGFPNDALKLFQEMQIEKIHPNEVTLVVALTACSQVGCLALGQWIHAFISRVFNGHRSPTMSNALMHMYAKCGQLDVALEIFINQENKNLESWNTLLTGFALHGFAESSFSLFSQMIRTRILPDRITFLALLIACSHAGMIVGALSFFMRFAKVYGIEPGVEHYGCMVDVLSRRGQLEEARMLIETMPLEPDATGWGALLRGCFTYQNHKLGFEAAKRLLELEPRDEGRYIALSNLFFMNGVVEDAIKVRKKMVDMGIRKSSGASLIEVDGEIQEFLSGDRSHILANVIYATVDSIHSNME